VGGVGVGGWGLGSGPPTPTPKPPIPNPQSPSIFEINNIYKIHNYKLNKFIIKINK